MSDTDREDSTSRIAWFLTGAIIGATAAILYAPKSGKETREYLSRMTHEGSEAVETSAHDVVEQGREIYDKGRRMFDDAADLFERGRKLMRG